MPAIGSLRRLFQALVLASIRMSFAQLSSFAWEFHCSMHLFLALLSSGDGKACPEQMDVFGDHAPCCHNGPSLVFRHNNVRDILGHSARAAGLAAVVIEKKNQIEGSRTKPGDITVQQ